MRPRAHLVRADAFTIVVLTAAAIYVAMCWTPSSYAEVFDRLGAPRRGLVAGEPREIREDEWARWTPFVQAAVNNGFRRFNATSAYGEDLRGVEGLPLADWALAFKPYFWLFFVGDPAHAFSLYHAFWMAAFLIGYQRLFRRLGSTGGEATGASLALFFTAFVQTWWTTYGPVVAGFPFLLLVVLAPMRPWIRGLAAAYLTAAWLLANLYPPLEIPLVFVAVVTLLALAPDALRLRRLLPSALGAAVGGLLVVLYLGDVFDVMADTLYPGQRVASGGGRPAIQWAAQLFPHLVTSGFTSLIEENICQTSVAATHLPLLLLFLVDHRALAARLRARDADAAQLRRAVAVLTVAILIMSCWMLLPLPPEVGRLLLWHRVPPTRLWFPCGLSILILALRVLRDARPQVTLPRLAALTAAVAAGWFASEHVLAGDGSEPRYGEFWILLPLLGVFVARRAIGGHLRAALVGCAAFSNAVSFGTFNPIQSAAPIFQRPEGPVPAALDRLAARHPRGWLVLLNGYGAWLNGLGYAAVTHVLLAPDLAFFRDRFPDLDERRFTEVFNRSTYVLLTPADDPVVIRDSVVAVPIEAFQPPRVDVRLGVPEGELRTAGRLRTRREVSVDGNVAHVVLNGWARYDASDPDARLWVESELPIGSAVAYPLLRPDVARLLRDPGLVLSGFALRMDLDVGALREQIARQDGEEAVDAGGLLRALAERRVCVHSQDPKRGLFLLRGGEDDDCFLPGASSRHSDSE